MKYILIIFTMIQAFFTTYLEKLATPVTKTISTVKLKIKEQTASMVETFHAMFMLPTLLRK